MSQAMKKISGHELKQSIEMSMRVFQNATAKMSRLIKEADVDAENYLVPKDARGTKLAFYLAVNGDSVVKMAKRGVARQEIRSGLKPNSLSQKMARKLARDQAQAQISGGDDDDDDDAKVKGMAAILRSRMNEILVATRSTLFTPILRRFASHTAPAKPRTSNPPRL
jgi:hypothetical protein